jgi:hypothetical protein
VSECERESERESGRDGKRERERKGERETRSKSPLENFFHDSFWFRVQGLGFELGVWG